MKIQWQSRGVILSAAFALFIAVSPQAAAELSSSTNYRLDSSTSSNFGGTGNSSSYRLESSGGESVIGNGASGSYRLGQGYVARQEKSLQVSVQRANLGAYFPFDEGTGTNAYDYTLNNGRVTMLGNPPGTWTQGKVAGAMRLAGGAKASASQTSAMQPTSQFTLSAWLRSENHLNTSDMPIYSTISGNSGYALKINGGVTPPYCAASDVCFSMSIGGSVRSVGFSKTVDSAAIGNAWALITATYDGSQLKIYLNGVEKASVAASGAITHSSGPLCVASELSAGACSGNQTEMQFDETKILSTALSAAEILAEYNAGNSGVPSGFLFPAPVTSTSATLPFRTVIDTDGVNYGLAINQNQNLSNGSTTIPAAPGSIETPASWNEGSTRGLGFSLAGTNATAIPGKWSGGNAYAGIPLPSSVFYNRTGGGGGARDTLDMRLRLAVDGAQAQGSYSNQMTISGTITP